MAAINVPRLLDDLVDVSVASPDAGDALVWVASNNRWEAVAAGIGLGVDVVDMANNQFLVRGTSDPATDATLTARQAIIRIKTDGGGSKASLEYLVERVYYSDAVVLPRRVEGSTTNNVTLHTTGLPDQVAPAAGAYPLVLANILATPLKLLAPLLSQHVAPGGHLVLAGILDRQAQELQEAYAPWLQLAVADREEGWILMTAQRPLP